MNANRSTLALLLSLALSYQNLSAFAQTAATPSLNQLDDRVTAALLKGDWAAVKATLSSQNAGGNSAPLHRWLGAIADRETGNWNDNSASVSLTEKEMDTINDVISEFSAKNSNNPTALILQAQIQAELELDDEAIDTVDRVIKLNVHPAYANSIKGSVLAFRGLSSESEALYSEALKINPQRVDALLGRAQVRLQNLLLPEARVDAEAALKLAPTLSLALNLYAIIRFSQGDVRDAGQSFRRMGDAAAEIKRNNLLILAIAQRNLKAQVTETTEQDEGSFVGSITFVAAPDNKMDEATRNVQEALNAKLGKQGKDGKIAPQVFKVTNEQSMEKAKQLANSGKNVIVQMNNTEASKNAQKGFFESKTPPKKIAVNGYSQGNEGAEILIRGAEQYEKSSQTANFKGNQVKFKSTHIVDVTERDSGHSADLSRIAEGAAKRSQTKTVYVVGDNGKATDPFAQQGFKTVTRPKQEMPTTVTNTKGGGVDVSLGVGDKGASAGVKVGGSVSQSKTSLENKNDRFGARPDTAVKVQQGDQVKYNKNSSLPQMMKDDLAVSTAKLKPQTASTTNLGSGGGISNGKTSGSGANATSKSPQPAVKKEGGVRLDGKDSVTERTWENAVPQYWKVILPNIPGRVLLIDLIDLK